MNHIASPSVPFWEKTRGSLRKDSAATKAPTAASCDESISIEYVFSVALSEVEEVSIWKQSTAWQIYGKPVEVAVPCKIQLIATDPFSTTIKAVGFAVVPWYG